EDAEDAVAGEEAQLVGDSLVLLRPLRTSRHDRHVSYDHRERSAASEDADELLRVLAALEQVADVLLRTPQRLEGRHALQGLAPREVEDDRIPRRGRDLLGIERQAPAA